VSEKVVGRPLPLVRQRDEKKRADLITSEEEEESGQAISLFPSRRRSNSVIPAWRNTCNRNPKVACKVHVHVQTADSRFWPAPLAPPIADCLILARGWPAPESNTFDAAFNVP